MLLVFVLSLFLFFSCTGEDYSAYDSLKTVEMYEPEAPAARRSAPDALSFAKEAAVSESNYAASGSSDTAPAADLPGPGRLKKFSGGCTIETSSPSGETVRIKSMAEKHGGWVESSSASHVAIRVPAENFRTLFDLILESGNVLERYEEADDVTEYYYDMQARLSILLEARERLQKLLLDEKTTEKKVQVLRELKKIDDRIGRLKAEIESLSAAVAYSSITVTFVMPEYGYSGEIIRLFPWIEKLDPFSVSIENLYRKVLFALPEDFAVIKSRKSSYFHAETADGTVVRIASIKNNPYGTAAFWQKAILDTLGMRFSEASEGAAGNVSYVVFNAKGTFNYRYLVGTLTKRKLLYVIEVFYPDMTAAEKWGSIVEASLGRLEIR